MDTKICFHDIYLHLCYFICLGSRKICWVSHKSCNFVNWLHCKTKKRSCICSPCVSQCIKKYFRGIKSKRSNNLFGWWFEAFGQGFCITVTKKNSTSAEYCMAYEGIN